MDILAADIRPAAVTSRDVGLKSSGFTSMTAGVDSKQRWTVDEYLEMERRSVDKHEYCDGEIFPLAGASYEHNLIVSNLITAVNQALGGRCKVFPSDMRLLVASRGLYTYADVSVLCGEPELTGEKPPALKNPSLLFEVLSESSESYDRGKKFESYRSMNSPTDYVLLAQDRVLAEHYTRQADGTWVLREVRAGRSLSFACGEIRLDDVYRGVIPLP